MMAATPAIRRAVSVSLGSSRRDHACTLRLLGADVRLERVGTDGDASRAAALCRALDGEVGALGIGGASLAFVLDGRRYPVAAAQRMVAGVEQTPCVDGAGVKEALEPGIARLLGESLADEIRPRRALIASRLDRPGMAAGFADAGFDCVYGDLMFGLGLPVPLRRRATFHLLGRCLLPAVRRAPMRLLYPVGAAQELGRPRFARWYRWATVLCGDCHYLKRYAPDDLEGKVVATNTTTDDDLEFFRRRGARWLVTSTPRIDGRTFGTNLMEAALVAVAGRRLGVDETRTLARRAGWRPELRRL